MESVFISWLNKISFGDVVAFLMVGGGIVATITVAIMKFLKKYKENVEKETLEKVNEESFENSMKSVEETVNQIQEHLVSVDDELKKLSENTNNRFTGLDDKLKEIQKQSIDGDESLKQSIESNKDSLANLDKKVGIIDQKTNILVESDKETIKATITEKYYIAIREQYIEVHTLETLETLYEKYLEENGNTFIANLMEEIRKLPHTPPQKRSEK